MHPLLQLCPTLATPWTVARQAPLSMGFSRQEYRNGLPCSPPQDLPDPGTEPASFKSPALAGGFFTTSTTREALNASSSMQTTPSIQSHVFGGKERNINQQNRIQGLSVCLYSEPLRVASSAFDFAVLTKRTCLGARSLRHKPDVSCSEFATPRWALTAGTRRHVLRDASLHRHRERWAGGFHGSGWPSRSLLSTLRFLEETHFGRTQWGCSLRTRSKQTFVILGRW